MLSILLKDCIKYTIVKDCINYASKGLSIFVTDCIKYTCKGLSKVYV